MFLDVKLRLEPTVEVAERDRYMDFHIWAPSLPTAVPKVTGAAEEARKEVKGVVVLARTPTLLVLLNAIVAILVIDFTGFLIAEDFVSFGYFYKLFVGRVVATRAS